MNKILLTLLCYLMVMPLMAQDIEGRWHGLLEVPNTRLRIIFDIQKVGEGYTGTMESPDQGAKGIPISSVTFEENRVLFKVDHLMITYEGVLTEARDLDGEFKQGGGVFPMKLTQKTPEIATPQNRPQNPKAPFPYRTEEVKIPSLVPGVTLAGTLVLPQQRGPHPAVVLVSGSGPNDRDQTILEHKPFWVLADYLARQGIASIRYDDRGVGGSTGNHGLATTKDLAVDAEAVFRYLRTRDEINPVQTGIIGHSEGGVIAPMVAAKLGNAVNFIVLMAAPGYSGKEVLLRQNVLLEETAGIPKASMDSAIFIREAIFNLGTNATDPQTAGIKVSNYINSHWEQIPKNSLRIHSKVFGCS